MMYDYTASFKFARRIFNKIMGGNTNQNSNLFH